MRLGDMALNEAFESAAVPTHCWEYFCRRASLAEEFKKCVVYRAVVIRSDSIVLDVVSVFIIGFLHLCAA